MLRPLTVEKLNLLVSSSAQKKYSRYIQAPRGKYLTPSSVCEPSETRITLHQRLNNSNLTVIVNSTLA